MATNSLRQSLPETQCITAARDLIQAVVDIKILHPFGYGYDSILNDPKVRHLINRLEKWTDILVARDGGL